jgi:NADPH:quinone reductase-like Zn-dependent oxidoreductase
LGDKNASSIHICSTLAPLLLASSRTDGFGHVVSALGWGTHALGPLSFRAATYSGVFTLLPLLTGEGRAHHGAILEQAARLAEAGKVVPLVDPRRYRLETVHDGYRDLEAQTAQGKLVVGIAEACQPIR